MSIQYKFYFMKIKKTKKYIAQKNQECLYS